MFTSVIASIQYTLYTPVTKSICVDFKQKAIKNPERVQQLVQHYNLGRIQQLTDRIDRIIGTA